MAGPIRRTMGITWLSGATKRAGSGIGGRLVQVYLRQPGRARPRSIVARHRPFVGGNLSVDAPSPPPHAIAAVTVKRLDHCTVSC